MDAASSIAFSQYRIILKMIYYLLYSACTPITVVDTFRRWRAYIRLEQERARLDVSSKCIDFSKFSPQRSNLNVSEFSPDNTARELARLQTPQQFTLHDMLSSIFERGYFLYCVDKYA
jgi:hypothetical protein